MIVGLLCEICFLSSFPAKAGFMTNALLYDVDVYMICSQVGIIMVDWTWNGYWAMLLLTGWSWLGDWSLWDSDFSGLINRGGLWVLQMQILTIVTVSLRSTRLFSLHAQEALRIWQYKKNYQFMIIAALKIFATSSRYCIQLTLRRCCKTANLLSTNNNFYALRLSCETSKA